MKLILALVITIGFCFLSLASSTNTLDQAENLLSRSYKLSSSSTFVEHLKNFLPPKPGESDTKLLIRFFKTKRIDIKAPESVYLNVELNTVFVHAPQSDQDKIERLIELLVRGKRSQKSVPQK